MQTALGSIIAKLVWATDWVLEQFFSVSDGYLNAAGNACQEQAVVSFTKCGQAMLENVATLVYALTGLGSEIFSALGVKAA